MDKSTLQELDEMMYIDTVLWCPYLFVQYRHVPLAQCATCLQLIVWRPLRLGPCEQRYEGYGEDGEEKGSGGVTWAAPFLHRLQYAMVVHCHNIFHVR